MTWFLYAFAVVASVINAVQSGANSSLGKALGQPFAAGLAIVAVSSTTLLAGGPASGQLAWPGAGKLAAVPWWAWLGGVLGAIYVMSQLVVAQRLGAAAYVGLAVTAAVLASVAFDHFGWLGFEEHPASLGRLLGAGLMVVGVGLIALF